MSAALRALRDCGVIALSDNGDFPEYVELIDGELATSELERRNGREVYLVRLTSVGRDVAEDNLMNEQSIPPGPICDQCGGEGRQEANRQRACWWCEGRGYRL